MSNVNNDMSTTDREIFAERIFNALRKLVWKVWTDSDHVTKWWGPDGLTNTIESMDIKPGVNGNLLCMAQVRNLLLL